MGTPINLGRIFGVYLRIDVTLFILAAIFMLQGLQGSGLQGLFDEATFVVLLFFCVFLHELGHAGGAYLFGIRTLDVTLTFFGGYARLASVPRRSIEDIVIAFAGPAMNLAIAGALYLWLYSPSSLSAPDHSWGIVWDLQRANLFLGVFNLLPGYPLDGGTITRAVLTNFMPRNRARLIVGYIGAAIGFVFVALALRGGGLGFGIFFGFLLIYWATMEIQAARSSRF
jgi:Zn-dependent protease